MGLAVLAATFGIGTGIVPIVRGVFPDLSFRVVLALAAIPLLLVPLVARLLRDPEIYEEVHEEQAAPGRFLPGAVPRAHRGRVALLLLMTAGLAIVTGPGFTYVIVVGEEVLGISSSITAWLVVAAGPAGLVGLIAGSWGADHVGRRLTAAIAMIATAAGFLLSYAGGNGVPVGTYMGGYLLAIAGSSMFLPASSALAAEAFPTSIRATVAGWGTAAGVAGAVTGIVLFGALLDVTGTFAVPALILTGVLAVSILALLGLPETRGIELTEVDADEASVGAEE